MKIKCEKEEDSLDATFVEKKVDSVTGAYDTSVNTELYNRSSHPTLTDLCKTTSGRLQNKKKQKK